MEELGPLVERAQNGDLEAYGEIVRRFQDMAYGYAYATLGEFHLAQDAAQEAFVQAYRDLTALREPAAFPGWFRKIVFKHCDRIQRRRRPAPESLDAAGGEPVSAEPGPAEAVEKQELRDSVLEAVRDLPEHQRAVTTLFYINGYSVNDIADFLETPAGTVKRRLYDSRKQLKGRMMAMVAQELKAGKPGAEFRELVGNAIALQGKERFAEAVAAHGAAMRAAEEEGVAVQEVYNSCWELLDSYVGAGQRQELAERMLALPISPSEDRSQWTREMLGSAAHIFLGAGKPERALELVPRMLELAEELKGLPQYHWDRIEILCVELGAAVAQGNKRKVNRLRTAVLEALQTFEAEVRAKYPAFCSAHDATDQEAQNWFRWLGHAYHSAAFWAFDRYMSDRESALRLMRRASDLRDLDATELLVARLVLSVENDRREALRRLRRAFQLCESAGQRDFFKKEFASAAGFEPVREDPEFLGVLKG